MIHCWKFFELFPLKSQIIKLYACYCLWNLLSYTGASWIVNILFRNCVRILICLAGTLSGFLLQSFRIVKQSEIPSGWWELFQVVFRIGQHWVMLLYPAWYSWVSSEIPAVGTSVFSQVSIRVWCLLVKKKLRILMSLNPTERHLWS